MSEDILEKQLFDIIKNKELSEEIKLAKLDMLIKLGANVNVVNKNNTPLMMACVFGHEKIARWLIDNGANIHQKDDVGRDALIIASWIGHNEKILELLIDNGADVNQKDNEGETALIRASSSGNIEHVKVLLNKGADINVVNDKKVGALYYAFLGKNKDIFNYLIEKGIDTSRDDAENILYSIMLGDDNKDLAIKLIEKGVGCKDSACLILASEKGFTDIVKLFLEKDVDVNAKNSFGKTPLMEAACNEHREIVELLIANGADIEATTRIGVNVLTTASVKREMKEMIMSAIEKRDAIKVEERKKDVGFWANLRKGMGLGD
jgi:ankyrin repeat protein